MTKGTLGASELKAKSRDQSQRKHPKMGLLIPGVVGLCLLMTLTAGLPSSSTAGRTSFLTAQAAAGDTVGFQCLHGEIYLNGTVQCHDSSFTSVVVCAYNGDGYIYNCWYTMKATPDSGYDFLNWSASGDSFLGSVGTEGRVSTSNPVSYWGQTCDGTCAGSLVLNTYAPGYFVKFSESGLGTGLTWTACVGSSCQSASAGSAITFTNLHGSNSWSVEDVTVECEHGTCTYYAPSPSSGTVSGSSDISVKFTEKVT